MLPRSTTELGLGVALLSSSSFLISRHVSASRRAARASTMLAASLAQGDLVLHVPHAPGPITLDGDTDDPGWLRLPGPARTGDWVFKDGKAARPYSDARLVW